MADMIDHSAIEEAQLNDGSFAYLKANSAHALPDSPTANGWSAKAIKKQLYKSTDILYLWMRKLASATKEEIVAIDAAMQRLAMNADSDGNVISQTYVKNERVSMTDSERESGTLPAIPSVGMLQKELSDVRESIVDGASESLDTLKEIEGAVDELHAILGTKVTYLSLTPENGFTEEMEGSLNVGDNEEGYCAVPVMKAWDGELLLYFKDAFSIYLRTSDGQSDQNPVFEGDIPKPNPLNWVGHIRAVWDGIFLRITKSEETHTAISGDDLESILN